MNYVYVIDFRRFIYIYFTPINTLNLHLHILIISEIVRITIISFQQFHMINNCTVYFKRNNEKVEM